MSLLITCFYPLRSLLFNNPQYFQARRSNIFIGAAFDETSIYAGTEFKLSICTIPIVVINSERHL